MEYGFHHWLEDEIDEANRIKQETNARAFNSRAAGFDQGYWDALCTVRDKLNELNARRNRIEAWMQSEQ